MEQPHARALGYMNPIYPSYSCKSFAQRNLKLG